MPTEQGPQTYRKPKAAHTIQTLADLNRYDSVVKTLRMLIANGELADYDDEIANRVKDAIEIVEGVCVLARG